MGWKITWLPGAIADLDAIAAYIGIDSPAHAAAFVSRLLDTALELSRFPRSYRRVSEWNNHRLRQ